MNAKTQQTPHALCNALCLSPFYMAYIMKALHNDKEDKFVMPDLIRHPVFLCCHGELVEPWIPAGVYPEPFDKLRVTYRRAGMTKKAGLKSIEKKRFSRFSRSSRLSRISTLRTQQTR